MPKDTKPITQKTIHLEGSAKRSIQLQDIWHPTLNPPFSDSLGTQSTRQVYLRRICNKHYSFQSLRSVLNGRGTTWYNCKICKRYQSNKNRLPKATEVETAVFKRVNADLNLNDGDWITDSRPLCDGSGVGSADIFIPSRNCIVQIDGSSHFVHKYDILECEQRKIDDRFNIQAIKQFHVIRLHEDDIHTLSTCWEAVLDRQKEMIELKNNEDHHVLHYSDSYYSEKLVDEGDRDDIEDRQYDYDWDVV